MKLSENFELWEFQRSEYAINNQIDNSVPPIYIPNVERLVVMVLQPLRDRVETAIIVNSGFRNPQVNEGVDGAANSAHLKGLASDILTFQHTPHELTQMIVDMDLPFDKVIHEFGKWTHVSVSEIDVLPRKEVWTAYKDSNDDTQYAEGNHTIDTLTALA